MKSYIVPKLLMWY